MQGTVRGTTTNLKGEYRITDLPPGVHTLVFSMVGYQRLTRAGCDRGSREGDDRRTSTCGPSPVQIDQVVVTASRRAQSLEEVPVSISVLDAAEIRERNALVLDDALRYIPGVNMTGFQVNIRGSSGYNRGAGSRVLLLLDGIPFITGDTGELNFETIPVGQVDRIEVVKGASSALYGSNALGGVINVITKEIPERPSTQVRFFAGTYDQPSHAAWKWTDKQRFYNGQSVSHAYRSGDLGVGLFVSRQFDDGYRRNDYRRRYNIYAKIKEDYEKQSSLTMTFGLAVSVRRTVPLLAQSGFRDDIRRLPRRTTISSRSGISRRAQYTTLIGENAQLTHRLMWFHNDWGFETRSGIGRAESVADDIRYESVATIMPSEMHTVTAGLDANLDMIGGDVVGGRTIWGFALFGQDEMKLAAPLTMTFGARYDFSSVGITAPGGQVNPKLAFAYNPVRGHIGACIDRTRVSVCLRSPRRS